MLTVENIEKSYEEKPLLNKVTFEVNQGETVCLLGPSGSGKSTLLRIIAGLEKSEAGDVRWNQETLSATPAHLRRFGLMFQDYALFPHRDVGENIAFGLRMQNLPKAEIEKRVRSALETINMAAFQNRKVTDLSGGEQQRVALARALAPQPRLLMLDEPLGALDRTLREQLSLELRRILHDSGVPAIYVTHDQEEAFAIADRLLLLHNGQIIQEGMPHEIYHHPHNLWVARFFGLGNLVEGTVTGTDPLTLQTPLGEIRAAGNGASPQMGQHATLLFRPEQAKVKSELGDVHFSGEVLDQVFQGNAYRITLKINPEIPSFTILQPNPVNMGDRVSFGYHHGDILCLSNGKDTE